MGLQSEILYLRSLIVLSAPCFSKRMHLFPENTHRNVKVTDLKSATFKHFRIRINAYIGIERETE